MKLMQFLMGLDDAYMQIRSSILSRETLHDVRSAYAIISSEESHTVASGNFQSSSNGFSNEQMATLIFLIKENSINGKGVHANMAGATQHMTYTDKNLVNVIDVSYLKIKVSHPNGTGVFITKIGNMPLTDYLTLYDILVVPEYCVSLMSVHKVARDSKLIVAFDEINCYVLNQDLRTGKILGTGKHISRLYYFDENQGIGLESSKINNVCFLSKQTWHCRLGHPVDQVLEVLKPTLSFENKEFDLVCDVFQRAKRTREPFPLSDHVSIELGELVYLDLWGPYKVTIRDRLSLNGTLRSLGVTMVLNLLINNLMLSVNQTGGIPLYMWTDCILTTTYLINRLPTFVLNRKSPYDLVYNKPHSLKHLTSFGCLAYAPIFNSHDKFGSRDVKFFEDIFPFKQNVSSTIDNSVQDVNHLNFFNTNTLDDLPDILNDEEIRNPSPKRHGTPPSHSGSPSAPSNENDDGHFQGADASAIESERYADLEENIVNSEGDDLQYHLQEGINQVNDNVDARNAEKDALYRSNTWELADLLIGRKAIGFKLLSHPAKSGNTRLVKKVRGTVEASESFRGKLVKTIGEEASCCRTSCIYRGEEDQLFSIRSSSESKMACAKRGLDRVLVAEFIDGEQFVTEEIIEEVRIKASQCEEGCFKAIEGNAKEY
ncbi:ribonuclease H-like domain-containing protein [Tanacetum coccineum]|uniref:Ribonuclease H-like domain-containing protein n=1 Tax=Tanacetum coccineum TaxID=301880 RepID=A0ABQ4ZH82_9ASTR